MMVTAGLAVWNAATQASCAEPCDDAPEPAIVPERSLIEALGAGVADSFAAHEAKSMVPAMAMAPMAPKRVCRESREVKVMPLSGVRCE